MCYFFIQYHANDTFYAAGDAWMMAAKEELSGH